MRSAIDQPRTRPDADRFDLRNPGARLMETATTTTLVDTAERDAAEPTRRFYRHRLPIRVMHWINVVCLTILLMSGLNIFNAHPALYWGQGSTFDRPWVSIGAEDTPTGPIGKTRIAGHDS
jgi:hypothetical protein